MKQDFAGLHLLVLCWKLIWAGSALGCLWCLRVGTGINPCKLVLAAMRCFRKYMRNWTKIHWSLFRKVIIRSSSSEASWDCIWLLLKTLMHLLFMSLSSCFFASICTFVVNCVLQQGVHFCNYSLNLKSVFFGLF